MSRLVLAFAALLPFAVEVDAKCAMTELAPMMLSSPTVKLPADGGILIGFRSDVDRSGNARAELADQLKTWKWSVEVTTETLAPGLTLVHPKSGTSIAVKDAKGGAIGTFTRDASAKSAAPTGVPHISGVVITSHRSGRGTARTATATSSDPIPADAFAVILYDAAGKAISFETVPHVDVKNRTFEPWGDPGRCSFNPTGMVAPTVGQKVTMAWVDQFGHVSKKSAPVLVTEQKTASLDGDD